MAIQTASQTGVRKTITDLNESQQIRELNRQLDWIWRQLLGKLDYKAFSTSGLKQLIDTTRDALTIDLDEGDIGAAAFLDALWEFVLGKITKYKFSYAAIALMLSDAFDIRKNDDSVSIDNLVATEGNIRDALSGTVSRIDTALDAHDEAIESLGDRLDNLTVTNSMISQEVWNRIQSMIDESIPTEV